MLEERTEALGKLRRGVSFIVNRKVAQALGSWRATLLHQQERAEQASTMRRAVLRLKHGHLSRGFEGWVTTLEAAQRKVDAMRSSVRHMLHRQLSQGWGGWREMLTIRAAALAALRRSVMSLKHRKQRLGLSTWRDAAREAKGEATR